MTDTTTSSIRIDTDLVRRLKVEAAHQDTTVKALVETAVIMSLEAQPRTVPGVPAH